MELKEVKRVDILHSKVQDDLGWQRIVDMFPNMEALLYQPRGSLGHSGRPPFAQAARTIAGISADRAKNGESSILKTFELDLLYMDWDKRHGDGSEEEIIDALKADLSKAGVVLVQVKNSNGPYFGSEYYVGFLESLGRMPA